MPNQPITFSITLTEAEGDILANVMDSAIRTDGLKCAVQVVPLFNRLKTELELAKSVKAGQQTKIAMSEDLVKTASE